MFLLWKYFAYMGPNFHGLCPTKINYFVNVLSLYKKNPTFSKISRMVKPKFPFWMCSMALQKEIKGKVDKLQRWICIFIKSMDIGWPIILLYLVLPLCVVIPLVINGTAQNSWYF